MIACGGYARSSRRMGRRPACITAVRAAVSRAYASARRSNSPSHRPITPLARYVRDTANRPDSTLRCAFSRGRRLFPAVARFARPLNARKRIDRFGRPGDVWRAVACCPHAITDVACAWTRTAPRPHTDLYCLHPHSARPTARRFQSGYSIPYPLRRCPCDPRPRRREERRPVGGSGICECGA